MNEIDEKKAYIGDGVYVKYDGYHIVVMTNNPDKPDDTVYLDSSTAWNLIDYIQRMLRSE